MFMKQIAAGDKEREEKRLPSVPTDLKRQLAALQGDTPKNTIQRVRDRANQGVMEAAKQPVVLQGRQLDRSPGARTRTAPEVRKELEGIKESIKKGSMDLVFDDISRMLRGSLPQNIEIASAAGNEGFKTSRAEPLETRSGTVQTLKTLTVSLKSTSAFGETRIRKIGTKAPPKAKSSGKGVLVQF
jgi:hypothetical protein